MNSGAANSGAAELDLSFGAHRAALTSAFPGADPQDAVRVRRARTLPRHRARRRQWKPPVTESGLEAVQPQHAYHSNSFVR